MWELWGVEILVFPLTWHIAYTTACCYRTSRDYHSLLYPYHNLPYPYCYHNPTPTLPLSYPYLYYYYYYYYYYCDGSYISDKPQ